MPARRRSDRRTVTVTTVPVTLTAPGLFIGSPPLGPPPPLTPSGAAGAVTRVRRIQSELLRALDRDSLVVSERRPQFT